MVETSHPGNIGAAARAMKTMGLSKLVLVKPEEFPAQKAIWRSAGASDVVENAEVVASLPEAISDCSLVVAASARQRRIPWPMMNPEECAKKALDFSEADEQIAIVASALGPFDEGFALHAVDRRLAQGFAPCEAEEPVAAVRC